ncbi:MAG TPA: beta-ketoacyl-ACP synthase II [Gammaproteobacteria bacterium]
MSKRRVVVTGMGIISPVGNSIEESWANILAGKSGVGQVTHFDVTNYPTKIAAEVKNFDPAQYITPKDIKKMDPFVHYGIAASVQAFKDSGIQVTPENAARIGVAVGAGIGGLTNIEKAHSSIIDNNGPKRVSPFFVPSSIINMISGHLSIMYGLKGPNYAVVTACTTANHNIGLAMRNIQYGEADVMVAGGAEMAVTPLGLGGFCAARALSERNDAPEKASRPWDKDRDGFVLGEGAGVLVLEEYEHAKKRGAKIYCELIGFGMSGDAYHMTSPPDDGEGARLCMTNSLNDAGIKPEQVDYINAHGTSTPVGDKGETIAIKRAFGDYAKKVAISSTKSMTGHLLGAAGGVEAVFSILAMRDQVAPPTINLENPDPECDLDYVPNKARKMKIDVVLSNSFGFGGTNGTLVFRRI